MSKPFPFLFTIAVLILSACQQAPATLASEATLQERQPPTSLPLPTTVMPSAGLTSPEPAETAVARCTVVSSQPASGESPYPLVGERDWRIGPDTATVTIIEYSDFQ
jgi:hypothetical protein